MVFLTNKISLVESPGFLIEGRHNNIHAVISALGVLFLHVILV
jgi:hypothetical protein